MRPLHDLDDNELTRVRRRLSALLMRLVDFTPASLHQEWRRCGKPGCSCARPDDPGHGPRYKLVRREGGRVVTWQVPAGLAEEYRARTHRWKQFQRVCAQLADVNAELDRRRLGKNP